MAALASSGAGGGAVEAIFTRRIAFHPARKPYNAVSSAGENGFYLETLNPSGAGAGANQKRPREVAFGAENSAGAPGKRVEGGAEFFEHGFDQELGFRITFRRIGAGLANLGNTCFLNSVLQCLTYTEPFAAYLQSGKHKNSCRTAGFCALCALQNHVMRALQSSGKILSPFDLVRNLRCISRNFRNSRQEDAHEYMVHLLESMHKCCLPSGVPSESPSAYEKSLVHKIFGGRLRSQVKCTQCQFCSNKYDPFLDLSLEIVKAETLRKALSNFTAVEKLDGGEKQYECQRCKQKVRALKQLTIHKPPHVLTVHLKRFSAYMPGHKIDKKVEFEPFLDLKPFVSDPNEGNLKYVLYGVLVHAGWSTHSGHYYCFVRTSSGMWHSLDDNQVRQVSEKTVLAQKAYMLFYVRVRGPVKSSVSAFQKQNPAANTYESKNNHRLATLNGANALVQPMESLKGRTNPNAPSSSMPILQNGNPLTVQKLSNLQSKGNSDPVTSKDAVTKDHNLVPSAVEPSVVTIVTGNCSIKVSESLEEQPQKRSGNVGTHVVEVGKAIEVGCTTSNGVEALAKHEHPQGDLSTGVNDLAKPEPLANATNGDDTPAKHELLQSNGADASVKPEVKDITSNFPDTNQNKLLNGADTSVKPEVKDITSNFPDTNQNKLLNVSAVPKYDAPSDKQEHSKEKMKANDAKTVNQTPIAPTASTTQSVDNKMHNELEVKSRKFTKRSTKIACFARNTLFVHTLRMQKNKKFKKSKRRRLASNEGDNPGTIDQQASTSTSSSNGRIVTARQEKSLKRKHSKSSVKKNGGDPLGVNVLKEDFQSIRSGVHANIGQSKINQAVPEDRLAADNTVNKENEASQRCESYSLLMQGLKEVSVPSWDGVELPKVEMRRAESSKQKSIGYVLDEWDEEYDRGRRKKVKQSQVDFEGLNPFQETANINAQKKMRKLKTVRSGNKPFRN
ncbi:hypothetical protein LUZ62_029025 [Rhynchospora pubera]|uniref:Ubiquitin carboxyl-terminal hydrolase n=1 Tax=Rhynchospora pubera TaxID=906938 RepID=A0AAV8HIF4_9POAL|nr:hypothetical protein LUZ62_029025 [Rhynchospora pubera]